MADSDKDLVPVDGAKSGTEQESKALIEPSYSVATVDHSLESFSIPSIPSSTTEEPSSKKKRNPVVNVVVHVAQSIGNSIYDVAFRPANPRTPANAVYIDYFLKSTFRDFKQLGQIPDVVRQHEWIDSERLPFLEIVLQLPNMDIDTVRSRCDILFSCLFISAIVMIYALYKTLYSVGLIIFLDGFMAAQILSAVYWFVFFLFSGFGYFYYNYHTWIIASDRFGLPVHFLSEIRSAERAALFPFYDYYLRYLR
ncbi:hypothetical protein KW429_11060 [Vibrio fluvialis]|nr:hypothetical protein [Vibrio fluvialis]MBY7902391.1 hypothetical protein [Vibrio fluvialis]